MPLRPPQDFAHKEHEVLRTIGYLFLLLILLALFFWKVVFTGQFSIAEDWETANQGYAWHQFAASSIHKGVLPVWDPYAQSGRPHIGEMQPGLFYPPKLILYLWPLNPSRLLSPRLFDHYYFFTRLLAACFLFFLARELGVKNRFAALVAAFCFAAGGFVGNAGGLQLLDSAIWLPLVLLFLSRASRSGAGLRGVFYACVSGACMGMTVLAGSIHVPLMDAMVVVSAAIFLALRSFEGQRSRSDRARALCWSIAVIVIVGVVAFASAGIQLLPSIEYAPLSYRWGSGGRTLSKMPYSDLSGSWFLPPSSIVAMLIGGMAPSGLEPGTNPYVGILPLCLMAVGVWVCWAHPWVKYLSGLAVLSFFYGMGAYSILHGVLYLLPFLDMAREPDRFIYLTHFSIALLAGFGMQAMQESGAQLRAQLPRIVRALGILTGVFATLLLAATVLHPAQSEWHFFSLIVLIASWGVLSYLLRGNPARTSKALLVAIIASDLYAFNWSSRDRAASRQKGEDYQQQLLDTSPLGKFFHEQEAAKGLFRVHVLADDREPISLGDMFSVQTTVGQSATSLLDYMPLTWSRPGLDLLNARYVAAAGKASSGPVVFETGKWKVHEIDTALPRAWVVSRVMVEPSREKARRRIEDPGFNARRVALVSEPISGTLSSKDVLAQQVSFIRYEANRLELEVQVDDTGFLVLSEMYYPGWEAAIDGKPAKIYRADSILRGLIVPRGVSRVVFSYRPMSLRLGAGLSLFTLACIVVLGMVWVLKSRANGGHASVDAARG